MPPPPTPPPRPPPPPGYPEPPPWPPESNEAFTCFAHGESVRILLMSSLVQSVDSFEFQTSEAQKATAHAMAAKPARRTILFFMMLSQTLGSPQTFRPSPAQLR